MKFDKKTVWGTFVRRPNRFQGYVMLDGEEILLHVPNTGRLKEILIPGVECLVRVEDNPKRKTSHSLIGAMKNGFLINFDSQAPNRVVEEALREGWIEKLKEYTIIEREKTFGTSRFDFRLTMKDGNIYFLEVKGVTLEKDGVVSFPDAKTPRGARHLRELCEAKKMGYGSGVLLLVQMEKASHFEPNRDMDPDFADALREAKDCGVDIFSYLCETREDSLTLSKELPVILK